MRRSKSTCTAGDEQPARRELPADFATASPRRAVAFATTWLGRAFALAALIAATLMGTAGSGVGLASAQAATAPAAVTGGQTAVGYSTVTLAGAVNPKGSETLYYFQYGITKAYTAQTGLLDAGAGTTTVRVRVELSGLAPLTIYHYRLVAVNGVGRTLGADRAFSTRRVPLSLAILSSPDPAQFGGAVIIQGTLSGTGNGNREVVLQANGFPYTGGWGNVENPVITGATGSFAFHLLGVGESAQYRVVSVTKPVVVSPVVSESVIPAVSAHSHRLRFEGRRRLVRFFGTVAPAQDGLHIAIMRMVHGHSVFVAGGALRHLSAARSRFNRVLRVRPGVFRVLVKPASGVLGPTYSAPLLIR